MAQHLVASKTVRQELLTATHAQRATIVHHALSIVMLDQLASSKTDHNVIRTSLVQPVLSEAQPLLGTRVTHAQRATIVHHALSIVTHVRHRALSIAQTHVDHASSMTAHASSTATTATTAPTVVQTALTV